MRRLLNVLIIDDCPDAADRLSTALSLGGYDVAFAVVDTPDSLRLALERQEWDLITADNALPDFSALEALALVREVRQDVPFVIISAESDINSAILQMKAGADDYIQKDEAARLVPAVQRVLRETKIRREMKRQEALFKASEMRYRRLFETAKDGILILDADTGVINDVNPFLLNMLGYAFADIVGKKLWDIGMFTDVEASKNDFRELQQNRYIRYEDLPLRKRDGQLLDVEYISNVYQVDGDKVIQCNIRDITDRKKAEAQVKILDAFLEKRAADLERANRELEAFSYTVSHDLHTPLTNISSFCQLVQDQCAANLDDQCRKHLQEIYAGVERMNGLIATLLEFSRLSHCTLHPAAVDLTETAMVIAVELSLTNLQRHVTLNIADNMTVNGDGKLLHIALANLLGNAWKYTEKTAAAVIDFGCADQAGKQVYFVRDNGAGFNMAQVDKLFSAFNRLEGAEEYTGMGIGLATVKRIIERHGGKVWGEGEAGSGATFYFTLDTSLSRECAELGSRPDTVTGKATAPLAATGIAGT